MFYNIRISATNGPEECFKYISEALQTFVAPLASAMKKASGSSSSIFDIYLFKQTAPEATSRSLSTSSKVSEKNK